MNPRKYLPLTHAILFVACGSILALAASPNFLKASLKVRSVKTLSDLKELHDMTIARYFDIGLWPIDGSDSGEARESDPPNRCIFEGGYHFFGLTCSESINISCQGCGDNFFNGQIWALLTTPVSYMHTIPKDPFGGGMFYGFEDRDCSNGRHSTHWIMFSSGPDRDTCDWIDRTAEPYNPSNGLTSNGDIWRAHIINDLYFSHEFKGIKTVAFEFD